MAKVQTSLVNLARTNCVVLLLLLAAATSSKAANTHRHHHHQQQQQPKHKRVLEVMDYEYPTDYTSGVAVDAVPMTSSGTTKKADSKRKCQPFNDDYGSGGDEAGGVVHDCVPMSTDAAPEPTADDGAKRSSSTTLSDIDSRRSQITNKTNRLTKLRKLYDSDDERRWYEAIFAQRK